MMQILDSAGRPFPATAKANRLATVEYFPWQTEHGKSTPTNYAKLIAAYEGWVHHCLWLNAQAISDITLRLYAVGSVQAPSIKASRKATRLIESLPYVRRKVARAGGKFVELLDHPALDLLENPNPYMTGREFRQHLELFRGLTGNAYVWKERGPLGVPIGLWPISPVWMKIVPGKTEMVVGYFYKRGVHEIAFDVDEIIHLRRPNPADPYYYGYGETESEQDIAALDDAITSYERHTMENNARPDFVVESEYPLQPEQANDLRREWQRLYGGVANANKVAILSGGLKAKPLNFSPKEVAHIAGEDRVMRRVGMAFGIPKSMLTTDDVNLANAEIGERQHAKYTLKPRLANDCEALTKYWVSGYDKKLFLAFDDPVKENQKEQAETDQIRVSIGLRTINEIRARDDYPPLDGGDEAAFQRSERQGAERAEAQAAQLEAMQQAQQQNQNQLPPPKEPEKSVKAADWQDSPEELAMAAAMRGVFVRVRRDLLGRGKAVKAILPAGEQMLTSSEVTRIEAEVAAMAAEWTQATAEAMSPHLRATIGDGWELGETVLARAGAPVGIGFDVSNPRVADFIETYTRRFAKGITGVTQERIRTHLAASLREGESINKLRNRLMQMCDGFEKSRATAIARSEASRASHAGEVESWKESGEVRGLVWRTADSPCEYCAALDGTVVSIDGGSFAALGTEIEGVDGGRMKVNYEALPDTGGIGQPPLHPNCRCTLLPELIQR